MWPTTFLLPIILSASCVCFAGPASAPAEAPRASELFAERNLVAWCIVPFDARRRGPEERAEMLRRLGFTRFAYDWRAEHIASFDEELDTLQRWGISLDAFWFPGGLNDEARTILSVLERHHVQTQLWVTLGFGDLIAGERDEAGAVMPAARDEHAKRVDQAASAIKPIAEAAAKIDCRVGLYNHGGWFGEPENQIEIIERLKASGITNVGIVYNQHHGHDHIARFPRLLRQMLPHLYCLNLNGMIRDGERGGKKIWTLGHGELDLELLRTIRDSGYRGLIGILGHTMDDAEDTLRDNLEGLKWLLPQLAGTPATQPAPAPTRGSYRDGVGEASVSTAFGQALRGGILAEPNSAYRTPPITVECRTRLASKRDYNILVSCEPKSSPGHWEIFTWKNWGHLTVYLPGSRPDHVRSSVDLCDGQWHAIAMHYEPTRLRLYIDGKVVVDRAITPREQPTSPAALAIGRLVEGGLNCDGVIDDVRISTGIRPIVPPTDKPLTRDETTIQLWNFDTLPSPGIRGQRWAVEDPKRRAELPEFQIIPAARPDELTPANPPQPPPAANWARSHGDDAGTRYSALKQIHRGNVAQLKPAWAYHSEDGVGNIQCNPVIANGVMYAPTVGEHVVAVNAITGREIWRFKPGGRPAFRGLLYWNGEGGPRLLVSAGQYLWAINPADGKPIASFGDAGRVLTGECRVAGAVFDNVFVVPGYLRDVYGIDVRTGKLLWTFHTVPQPGEYGSDTWNRAENGANCWGGMVLDAQRGIAYVSTGSPKPDFVGVNHQGSNLFANCLIALDAKTGRRLWHFQEVRHDIWDRDIPAPPNLVTIERNGQKIDAVAQVTKLGNTLLVDRVTGKPIYPFRLRRAPVSKLPGERTWPYQPDLELPEPFSQQRFTRDDITDRSEEATRFVTGRIGTASMGWFEPFEEGRPNVVTHVHGGAEWTGAAADPRGRLYVSANEMQWLISVFQPDERPRDPHAPPTPGQKLYLTNCASCHGIDRVGIGMAPPLQGLGQRMKDAEVRQLLKTGRNNMPVAPPMTEQQTQALLDFLYQRDLPASTQPAPPRSTPHYGHNGYPKLLDHEGYPACKPPWGTLNCIDLNTGKIAWKVPLGEYPQLAEEGLTGTGAENFGGATVTAGGLVFCAGTPDLKIRAFDSDTGAELWSHELAHGGYAPPAVYEAGGRQYVVIAATGGGKLGGEMGDEYVAFTLPD